MDSLPAGHGRADLAWIEGLLVAEFLKLVLSTADKLLRPGNRFNMNFSQIRNGNDTF